MPDEPNQMTPTMWGFLIAAVGAAATILGVFGKDILARVFGFARSKGAMSVRRERELRLDTEKRIADLIQNYQRGWEHLELRIKDLNAAIIQTAIAHKAELDGLHAAHAECLQDNARLKERLVHLEERVDQLEGKE
jgi:hypothetical protein